LQQRGGLHPAATEGSNEGSPIRQPTRGSEAAKNMGARFCCKEKTTRGAASGSDRREQRGQPHPAAFFLCSKRKARREWSPELREAEANGRPAARLRGICAKRPLIAAGLESRRRSNEGGCIRQRPKGATRAAPSGREPERGDERGKGGTDTASPQAASSGWIQGANPKSQTRRGLSCVSSAMVIYS